MKKYILLILIIVVVLSGCYLSFSFLNSPVDHNSSSGQFVVKPGESISSVAQNLKSQEFIRSESFFVALARLRKNNLSIKSGEYSIDDTMDTTDILDILSRGIVVTVRITIPEGLHIRQIASLIAEKGLASSEEFIDASYNHEVLKKFGIPFESAEGFLFPETYIVAKDLSARQLVEIFIKNFFDNLRAIPYVNYNNEELRKLVIIASLIEREARIDSERAIISAVFYNRLNQGKRLESCATIQYILDKPKERLLFSDLKINSPYNTYLNAGLPPGPIANPGIKSLIAALFPADVDYLFFVSKKDGSHHFSTTYSEHLKAIEKYNAKGTIGHQVS
jgi:UPF0755 protein